MNAFPWFVQLFFHKVRFVYDEFNGCVVDFHHEILARTSFIS